MKKICVIAAAVVIIFGCAAVQDNIRQLNPRIVYRDLTKPVAYKIPAADMNENKPEKAESTGQGTQPQYFVEFANESYQTFDETGLAGFTEQAKAQNLILIVGHSHGQSVAGTLALASKRAETIARHLQGRGYEKILVMASWGGQTTEFAPNRGVHVYVIEQPDQVKGLPIIIAKELKTGKEKSSSDLEMAGNGKKPLQDS